MYIDPKSKIAGRPTLQIRDLMRKIGGGNVSVELIAEYLDKSIQDTKKIITELLHENYIEINPNIPGKRNWYRTTLEGNSLGLASAAKPLKRSTAERKLSEFMERVKRINSDDSYLYKVKKVVVFGSYLSDRERINDIDVAVELSQKYDPDEQIRLNEERVRKAQENGKHFSTFIDQLFYSELEVMSFLKSKSRAISLHRTSDPILKQVKKMSSTTMRRPNQRQNTDRDSAVLHPGRLGAVS